MTPSELGQIKSQSDRSGAKVAPIKYAQDARATVGARIAAFIFRVLAFEQFAKRRATPARLNVYEN